VVGRSIRLHLHHCMALAWNLDFTVLSFEFFEELLP